jgi:hypothetical protein
VKRKVRRICPMCSKERKIIRSHIIPEFLLERAKDADHRFITLRPADRKARLQQQAFMEPLLCGRCDNDLNTNYEQHFFDFWYRAGAGPTVVGGPVYKLRVPDYSKFKLCLLSILWRAGVSTMRQFDNVELDAHEPILRSMILDGRAGKAFEYPIFGAVVTNPESLRVTNVVASPIETSWHERTGYMFIFGGVAWHFLLTTAELPVVEREGALAEDGTIRLPVIDLLQLKSFSQPFVDYALHSAEMGWRPPWESRDSGLT